VRQPKECRSDGHEVEREGSEAVIEPVRKREWSPGFWERLLQMAPEVNMEVPERLPSNPYRDSVLDELAND